MRLAEFPVKRPVTVVMMMLIIVVLGGLSLSRLTVDLMPQMKFPNISVVTTYSGVAPEEIEKSLTRPLESAIRTVPGIKNVKSTSQEGSALITAEFAWGTDLDEISAAIRDRIGMIRKFLPEGIDEPLVLKMDISQIPVVFLSLRGERELSELQKLADDNIAPRLERVNGVASVSSLGGRTREIQVRVAKSGLLAYGLSLDQIVNRIRFENLNVSAGTLKETQEQFLLRGLGEFKTLTELENLVVGAKSGTPIYLKDIAQITDAFADETGISRTNKKQGVSLIVQKETDANTVQVADRVKKLLSQINRELPSGVELVTVFDLSEMIGNSINALKRSALEGGILAFVIIFLFLLRFRPTFVVSLSIPLSILVAFVCMYFSKMTLNIMTLGGLVLALGRLVDDSIVVMENIFRHLRLEKGAKEAAVEGTSEVATAVMSSTLVTVVVFLPIVFATGVAGQLFKAFGACVFYSLMASLLVAFTVVPMLSSKFYRFGKGVGEEKEKGIYHAVREFYGKVLAWALSNKGKVISVAGIIFVITGVLFSLIGKEFLPQMTSGMYQIQVELPMGSSLNATEKLVGRIENRAMQFPDLDKVTSIVGTSKMQERHAAMSGTMQGSNTAQVMLRMLKGSKRVTPEREIYSAIKRIAQENPEAKVSLVQSGSMLFGTSRAIEVKIYGTDLETLRKLSENIKTEMQRISGLRDVASSMEKGSPELAMHFDRQRVANYGLTVGQVAQSVGTAVEGQVASLYHEAGEEIDIRVRLKEDDRKTLEDIKDVPIASPLGFIQPLRDIAEVKHREGPGIIRRENAKRLATVSADLSGRSLSKVSNDIARMLAKIKLPEGYFTEFGGQQKDMAETFLSLLLVLSLAILLVYMILASLYESLIHPLTIMFSVPFAFTGAIIALFIAGIPLGVTAFIGLIMLVGIVSTNAIVLIDFVLKSRQRGLARREAIVEAGKIRLRPILMTALATLFAMLPVALGKAEGMELQIPLGIAVVGGLFTSTLLTLIVIPCVYEIFDEIGVRITKRLVRFRATEGRENAKNSIQN
ncbi:MAG: efflux RND transporter permease subunit [Candidatus Edwardsbacteria bacterium]